MIKIVIQFNTYIKNRIKGQPKNQIIFSNEQKKKHCRKKWEGSLSKARKVVFCMQAPLLVYQITINDKLELFYNILNSSV